MSKARSDLGADCVLLSLPRRHRYHGRRLTDISAFWKARPVVPGFANRCWTLVTMPPQGFFNPRRFEVSAVDTPQFAHAEMIVVPVNLNLMATISKAWQQNGQ